MVPLSHFAKSCSDEHFAVVCMFVSMMCANLSYVQLFQVCNSIYVDSFVSVVVLFRRTETA